MMKKIIFFILIFLLMPVHFAAAQRESIAIVVNEDAISYSDLNDRIHMIIVSSGLPDTSDVREKLGPQIISALIEEQLKMQEAGKNEIIVTPEEIKQGFATIAQQNNVPLDKFEEMIKRSGISRSTMERQIEAQIAWGKVVQKEMRPRVNVTDGDIDSKLEQLKALKGQNEYLLAEIYLPVDDPKNEADILKLAEKLVSEIKSGKARFSAIAQQFSQAAGAAQGGDMGWVQGPQLPQELYDTLKTMALKDVSAPIRTISGYHILLLRDQRQITDETLPTREQVMNAIGTERLDRLQRRAFLDLKSAAFIENRAIAKTKSVAPSPIEAEPQPQGKDVSSKP